MISRSSTRARTVAAIGTAVAAALAAVAFLPVRTGQAGPAAPVATATRGDIVVTVGGVGRVVAEQAGAAAAAAPGVGSSTAAAPAPGSTGSGPSVPRDVVFAGVSGRLGRFLVVPGQRLAAGAPVALLDDGGSAALAAAQARDDVATAVLELRQKQTTDPAKGLPPIPAELRSARLALRLAQERSRLVAHPASSDVAAARLELDRAESDLAVVSRSPGSASLAAARLAIDVATQRLAQIGATNPVDVAAAKLELAKAQADLDALRAAPPGAAASAVSAAQLAVTLAQQRISELPSGSAPSDITAAQLELKKAQADLDALQRPPLAASAASLAAAQAAVDLANQRLVQLGSPASPLSLASAQLELRKAQADLEALQRAVAPRARAAARAAVSLARVRLFRLLHPTTAARDTARADVAKATADLRTLEQRGGPASPSDVAIARLKLEAARARLTAARLLVGRLTVRAPFAGTVTALLLARGAPTDPSTAVATVTDLSHLAVDVNLSEFDIARVKVGDAATLAVDALGGRKFPARVAYVAPVGMDNGGVVTFPVRVAFTRTAPVKPGMNVSARIVVAERQGVVTVPLEAVVDDTVTVITPDGVKTQRHVSLGLADNKRVQVTSGLRPGESVLLGMSGG